MVKAYLHFFANVIEQSALDEDLAFKIKNQILKEYRDGKVNEDGLIMRISFLTTYSDDFEFNLLKNYRALNNKGDSLCPYCFSEVDVDDSYCDFCGYDLIHDEELDFNLKKLDKRLILNSKELNELQSLSFHAMNSFKKIIESFLIFEGFEIEDDDIKTYSFNEDNPPVDPISDVYETVLNIFRGNDINEAYNINFSQSRLPSDEIFDLAVDKGYLDEDFNITGKGIRFVLSENLLLFYSSFLDYFNFVEFRQFYNDSDLDLSEAGIEFLNKHIDLAIKKEDHDYLTISYLTKSRILQDLNQDIESLRCDLKVFILNFNPLYPVSNHLPIDEDNAIFLNKFTKDYSVSEISKLFNEEWSKIDFKKITVNKKTCLKLLKKVLTSSDVEKTCQMIYNRFEVRYD